ncbi:outer membrane beta-barrel protein [Sphingomonas sp. BIUV-7]|uniref:Outer membrane beta-barrel protein n=1 Tax=Sphingomonas natans TaxID=3063330 RepID=A0ABT8YCU7_9SPHN|nr:outer membrane beta-barrel protein [Sphingomonas sp. BIUV-7]MDO6416169.1 outer membrane beta-barrel protein [Sphingomonas sp. BIUV-7]
MLRLIGFAVVTLTARPMNALAQPASSVAGNEILTRSRPGLDPIGIRLGGFTLYPTMQGVSGYDSNIYDVDRNIRRSSVFTLRPSLQLRSDWHRHQLKLNADAFFERYPNARAENNDQYNSALSGRLDLTGSLLIDGEAHANRSIERRGTAGDIVTRGEPIRFAQVGGGATIRRATGGLLAQIGGSIDHLSYQDARVGSQRIDQSYRDHEESGVTARLGYLVGPGIIVFVQGAHQREHYDRVTSAALLSSSQNTLLGGLQFAITRLISGEIGAGYLHRRFDNSPSATAFAYDGALTWNVTTLVTISARGRRTINESPTLSAAGILTDEVEGKVDYEPMRRLLLNAGLTRTRERYRGIDRRDRRTVANMGFRLLVNRFVELGLHYDRRKQSGAGLAGRSYRGSEARFTITVQK